MLHISLSSENYKLNSSEIAVHSCENEQNLENQMLVNMWNNGNSHPLRVGTQNSTTTWQFPTKLNTFLLNPVVALPGIHPKKREIYVCTKTSTWMFMIALFIIEKT